MRSTVSKVLGMYLLGIGLGCSLTPNAHAGVIEGFYNSMNRAFTFREEQKGNVTPDKPTLTQEIWVPYYDQDVSDAWSSYYTQPNLQPSQGFDGSSRVMRAKRVPQRNFEEGTAYSMGPDGQTYGSYDRHGRFIPETRSASQGQQPLGYQAIERRDAINWQQERPENLYIGDAGAAPWLQHNTGGNIGRKTQIGEPTYQWNEQPGHLRINPRPGDYDYQSQSGYNARMADATRAYSRDGIEVSRSTGFSDKNVRGDGSEKYQVNRGDTLSGISDKPQIYNDWELWPLIYDANRNQIKDPDYIRPGQNLNIPRNSTTSEQTDARKRARAKKPPHSFTDNR